MRGCLYRPLLNVSGIRFIRFLTYERYYSLREFGRTDLITALPPVPTVPSADHGTRGDTAGSVSHAAVLSQVGWHRQVGHVMECLTCCSLVSSRMARPGRSRDRTDQKLRDVKLLDPGSRLVAAHIAQSRERWTSELTCCGSSVRATSGARCLLLTGMVSARGNGHIDGQVTSVSRAGSVRLCGHVKRSLLNAAGYMKFPDRTVGVGVTVHVQQQQQQQQQQTSCATSVA